MTHFLGLDFGTSGCRAIVIDDAATVIATSSVAIPTPIRLDGHTVQDASLWWQALADTLATLFQQTNPKEIAALSIDGTSGTLLPVDAQGEPMGSAYMYNDSIPPDVAGLLTIYVPSHSAARGPTSGLGKWIALKRRFPQCHIAHQADWVAWRLGGRFLTSDENNALKTGYDPKSRAWPIWLENLVDISELLCIVPPGTLLGQCESPFARQLCLDPDTQIIAGTTDSVAAFIASGATLVGEGVTSLGSTLAIKMVTATPVDEPRFGIYSHRLGDLWLAGGASNSGGAVLRQYFTDQEIVRLSAEINPAHELDMGYYPLPHPGERFPYADPERQPILTPQPESRAAFLQAILEGIADIETLGYQRLRELGASPLRSVRTTGGGARNAAWTQLRARRLQVPLLPARHSESAYGAAMLAKQGYQKKTRSLPEG